MSKAQLDEAEKLIKSGSFEDDYDVEHELGRGRFAIVKRCVNKSTGKRYAAKIVKKSRSNTHGRSGREQLLMEISILHRSTHAKMVRLYDVYETRGEMQIILEYAEGGDLHRHCIETDIARTEKEICYLIRQILEAIRYLHGEKVVHLDLKPDNILLAKKAEVFPEIRLIDFGLSRSLEGPYSQFDIVGTAEYVSPEVLAFDAIDYGSDMWSIGVVTYVLLSGISPFAGDDVMETYANIGLVEYDFDCEEFDEISDAAIDFIEKLLLRTPKKRMSAREALEHEWIKQLDGGVSTQDVIMAQQAKKEPLPDDLEISPLQDEEFASSSESESSSLEKSSEIADEDRDSGLEEETKNEMISETLDNEATGKVKDVAASQVNEEGNINREESKSNAAVVINKDKVIDEITPLTNKGVEIIEDSKENVKIIDSPKEIVETGEKNEKIIDSPKEIVETTQKGVGIIDPSKEIVETSQKGVGVIDSSKEIDEANEESSKIIDSPKEIVESSVVTAEPIDSPKEMNDELSKKQDTPKSSVSDMMAKFSTKPGGVVSPKNDKFSRLSTSKSFDTGFLSKDKKTFSIPKLNKLERSLTIKGDEEKIHTSHSSEYLRSPEIKLKSIHHNGTAEKLIETTNSSDTSIQPTEKSDLVKETDKPFRKKTPVPIPPKKSGEEFPKPTAPVPKVKSGGVAAKMAKFGKPDDFSGKPPVSKTGNKFEKRIFSEKTVNDPDELISNDLFKKKYIPDTDDSDSNEPVNDTNTSISVEERAEQTQNKAKHFNKPKSPPPVACKPKSPIAGKMAEPSRDETKTESSTLKEPFSPTRESPTPRYKSPTGHKSPTPKSESPTPRYGSPTRVHISPTPGQESPTRYESPTPRHESSSRRDSSTRLESPTYRNESPTHRNESPTNRIESPTRNQSPTPRNKSPIFRHISPTPKYESPTIRSVETSPKVERKAPPPKPKAKPLKKPPEIALKPVRRKHSDIKPRGAESTVTKEEAAKPVEPESQSENIPEPEPKDEPKPEPQPVDPARALAAKVGSGLKFSLNIGGANTGGRKLNIGPLISVGAKHTTKEVKELHEIPESPKRVEKDENYGSFSEGRQVEEEKGEESIHNDNHRPSLIDTRGKNESFSRRRTNVSNEDSSHRKTYRRLYVTKVRNSKVYEHDFDISTEAAKIVQRVDKDVLQVEVKLKSTDLKLLP